MFELAFNTNTFQFLILFWLCSCFIIIFVDSGNAKKYGKNDVWNSKIYAPGAGVGTFDGRCFFSELLKITQLDY